MLVHQLLDRSASGIFNVVGNERVSKYDFAMQLASTFGLDKNLISSGSVRLRDKCVARPLDMSLSNKKVSEELNINIGGIKEHLLLMKHSPIPEVETI